MSVLLYGWTMWTLMEHLDKKLFGNYTWMLHAVLNSNPTKQQPYGYLPPHLTNYPNKMNKTC